MKRIRFSPFIVDIVDIESPYLFGINPFKTQLGYHLIIGIGQRNICISFYFHLNPFRLRGTK